MYRKHYTQDMEHAAARVLHQISEIFEDILREIQIKPFGRPKIVLRRIDALKPFYDDSTAQLRFHVYDREVTYGFPGKNKDEAWRFACVGKILHEVYEATRSGIAVTKRDIYYRDPELFKWQKTVDRYIDDIAHTFQVTRADLNVIASPKGLVAGLDLPSSPIVQLIPALPVELQKASLDGIKWILVVEKEASFRLLVEKNFHCYKNVGPGLLVTGKGYPDLATRRFLRAALDHERRSGWPPPVFGLFDCDPDGINILKTYRLGSKTLAQEQACNVPEMRWLGLRLEDDFLDLQTDKAVLALTSRDRAKATSMLYSGGICHISGDLLVDQDEWYGALQQMLMLNRKMEIQILEDRDGGLEGWLEDKLEMELKR